MRAFTVAFHHALPHGVLSAVWIPNTPDAVPAAELERLPAREAEAARALRGYRQGQFVGGRMALRAAFRQLGVDPEPLLCAPGGAPAVPSGFAASISHKGELAVGMASRSHGETLGIDLETYEPARPGIAPRILRPGELAVVQRLPPERRWIATLQRFSIKESIYKAIHPYVHRYVGFHEAEVHPDLLGRARARLHLEQGEGPFRVDARYSWLHGRLFTSVRIRPLAPQPGRASDPGRLSGADANPASTRSTELSGAMIAPLTRATLGCAHQHEASA